MNEDLPKDWNDARVRREIVFSSLHIGVTLEQFNKVLRSPVLERSIEWLYWLNMAAETYEPNNQP